MTRTIRSERELQSFKKLGTLRYLEEENEFGYMDLIERRRYLLHQLVIHKDSQSSVLQIQGELAKLKLMKQAFVDWYLRQGIDISNIEFGDEVRQKAPKGEIRTAPEKYTLRDFKRFERFVKNKKQLPAAIDFCKQCGFPHAESFLHQYRLRYLNKEWKKKE